MIVFLIVKFHILLFRTVNNTLIRAIKPNRWLKTISGFTSAIMAKNFRKIKIHSRQF